MRIFLNGMYNDNDDDDNKKMETIATRYKKGKQQIIIIQSTCFKTFFFFCLLLFILIPTLLYKAFYQSFIFCLVSVSEPENHFKLPTFFVWFLTNNTQYFRVIHYKNLPYKCSFFVFPLLQDSFDWTGWDNAKWVWTTGRISSAVSLPSIPAL